MSEQPEYVAWKMPANTVAILPPVALHVPGYRGLPGAEVETAPWLSREEQEMVLRAMEAARDDDFNAFAGNYVPQYNEAIALLQSRLHPQPEPHKATR